VVPAGCDAAAAGASADVPASSWPHEASKPVAASNTSIASELICLNTICILLNPPRLFTNDRHLDSFRAGVSGRAAGRYHRTGRARYHHDDDVHNPAMADRTEPGRLCMIPPQRAPEGANR
jgi:hypothetical protein